MGSILIWIFWAFAFPVLLFPIQAATSGIIKPNVVSVWSFANASSSEPPAACLAEDIVIKDFSPNLDSLVVVSLKTFLPVWEDSNDIFFLGSKCNRTVSRGLFFGYSRCAMNPFYICWGRARIGNPKLNCNVPFTCNNAFPIVNLKIRSLQKQKRILCYICTFLGSSGSRLSGNNACLYRLQLKVIHDTNRYPDTKAKYAKEEIPFFVRANSVLLGGWACSSSG